MKTLVIGASENPERYSNKAILSLLNNGHEVVAFAKRAGEVQGLPFLTSLELLEDIDTITLYLNPKHQEEYYDALLDLKPRRVIFNPGTENFEFMDKLKQKGIESVIACTLVMLSTNQY